MPYLRLDEAHIDEVDRFVLNTRKHGECIEWTGALSNRGYGYFRIGCALLRAHRASYGLFVGWLDPEKVVCHSCDNPKCVRPEHLWIGTQGENMRDMSSKGRAGRLLGERSPSSKLTAEKVLEMRQLRSKGMSYSQLARHFGVATMTAYNATVGRTWGSI